MKKLANRYLTRRSYAVSSEETDKKPGPSPCLAIYATCAEGLDSFRTHTEREVIAWHGLPATWDVSSVKLTRANSSMGNAWAYYTYYRVHSPGLIGLLEGQPRTWAPSKRGETHAVELRIRIRPYSIRRPCRAGRCRYQLHAVSPKSWRRTRGSKRRGNRWAIPHVEAGMVR